MKRRILYVEDDLELGELTYLILQRAGYAVEYRTSLRGIIGLITEFAPELLVLDIEVGNISSFDLIDDIRKNHPEIPVLFVSSHTDVETVSKGIEKGCEQFIKKPYGSKELLHNVEKLLPHEIHLAEFGNYELDLNGVLSFKNKPIGILPTKEQMIFQILVRNSNNLVSRSELFERVWNGDEADDSLNNCISHLRSFLSEGSHCILETIRGKGYMLRKNHISEQ